MRNFASSAGISLAVSAAAMSVASALFVPYGHPWASLAWAVLACAAAAWVARSSIDRTPRMSDVISGVEAESPRVSTAPEPGVTRTRAIS